MADPQDIGTVGSAAATLPGEEELVWVVMTLVIKRRHGENEPQRLRFFFVFHGEVASELEAISKL